MHKVWEIDEANLVEAKLGAFRKRVTLNGQEVHRGKIKKGEIRFALPDGRKAAISVKRPFVGGSEVGLRVDGAMVVETGKEPIRCEQCRKRAKPYDRFCGRCGKPMPTAEHYAARRNVAHATGAIKILALLFIVFGFVMYFVVKGQTAPMLAELQNAAPGATYDVNGRTWTAGELRAALMWEPRSALIVHLVLAAIMGVLAVWGASAPLAAVLVATATYAVVLIANAIADPATIAQGILVKIIIIAFLVKGIKAALALRALNAG